MSFSTALLPPDPSDVPNELRRRIQVLEDSMRMPGTGGYVFANNIGGNPSVLAPGVFAPLFSAGPEGACMVPPSGRVMVTMSMQSDITLPVSATNVLGRNEAGFTLSGANTRAVDVTQTLYHARSGAPASVQAYEGIGVSRSVLLEGLTCGTTTFTMVFRADKLGAVFPYVGGITLAVIPL